MGTRTLARHLCIQTKVEKTLRPCPKALAGGHCTGYNLNAPKVFTLRDDLGNHVMGIAGARID